VKPCNCLAVFNVAPFSGDLMRPNCVMLSKYISAVSTHSCFALSLLVAFFHSLSLIYRDGEIVIT
jgi:hypothetical protein